MDKKPAPNHVSRTAAEQAQIAVLEQEISELAAMRSELRTQLKSAHAEIQSGSVQPGAALDDEVVRSIQVMAAQGLPASAICKSLGVSRATYYRHRDRLAHSSSIGR